MFCAFSLEFSKLFNQKSYLFPLLLEQGIIHSGREFCWEEGVLELLWFIIGLFYYFWGQSLSVCCFVCLYIYIDIYLVLSLWHFNLSSFYNFQIRASSPLNGGCWIACWSNFNIWCTQSFLVKDWWIHRIRFIVLEETWLARTAEMVQLGLSFFWDNLCLLYVLCVDWVFGEMKGVVIVKHA